MATLRVRTFARYAELMGSPIEVSLQLPAPLTSVIDAVRSAPGGDALPRRLLVAINLQMVEPDATVHAGDEVALLPPLAGG